MSLVLRCDTCGALSEPVTLDTEADGCACCNPPTPVVDVPGQWSHSRDGNRSQCPTCIAALREAQRVRNEENRWHLYGPEEYKAMCDELRRQNAKARYGGDDV